MADMELALRRADSAGMISYNPGDDTFLIKDESKLNSAQLNALAGMKDKLSEAMGTGVAELLSKVLFDALDHVVVYPVADETGWKDGEGRVLPDAFVVPNNIEANNLHTRFIQTRRWLHQSGRRAKSQSSGCRPRVQ